MDKLKENLFPISVAAMVIALGALIWFLIAAPLLELGDKQRLLATATTRLRNYNKAEHVPIGRYRDHLAKQLEIYKNDVADAADFYDQKVKSFQLFFNDQELAPEQATFSADLNDRISQVLSQYQSDFGVQVVDPSAPRDGPPTVDLFQPTLPSEIPKVMKQYWMFDEVVKACSKLEIGGLLSIKYPAPSDATHEFYNTIDVEVTVRLPYSKVEDLVSELYLSERVLFQLQKLVYRNLPTMLEPYQELVHVKEFANRSESDAEPYDMVFPEPNADAVFLFHVVDWTGVPDEPDDGDDEG